MFTTKADIWAITLDVHAHAYASDATQLTPWLDTQETARAQKLHRPMDQHAFIAAHGLCRWMLAQLLGTQPEAIVFENTPPHVKPQLANTHRRHIAFSITHTNGLVACAVSDSARVVQLGIDSEDLSRTLEEASLPMFCSNQELAALQPREHADRIRAWVAKEAIAKACSAGLTMDLKTIELELPPMPASLGCCRPLSVPAQLGSVASWQLQHWQPTTSHGVTLAYQTPINLQEVSVRHEHLTHIPAQAGKKPSTDK